MINRKNLLPLAVAAALGASGAAQAVYISPSGGGAGAADVINIASIDWGVNSLLITPTSATDITSIDLALPGGGNLADIANQPTAVPDLTLGSIVQAFSQARLATFDVVGSTPVGTAPGLEWTFVTGFAEQVYDFALSATQGNSSAYFGTVTGGTNYFEIYAGSSDSNALTGENYANGTLILSGVVLPTTDVGNNATTSSFNANATQPSAQNQPTSIQNLDIFDDGNAPVDDYPAIDTITGNGSGGIVVQITSLDSSYFLDDITTLDINYTTQQRLAFNTQDPASCMYDGSGLILAAGNGYGSCDPGAGTPTGSVGAYNGLASGNYNWLNGGAAFAAAPNEILQIDASSSLPSAVPEPATLALLGVGIAGIGAGRRLRAKKFA